MENEQAANASATGPVEESSKGSNGELYDFRNPRRIHDGDLHELRQFHEQVGRYVTSSLSLFLRQEVSTRLNDLDACSYTKFVQLLSDPGHLCLFRLDPLPGIGLLNLNLRLALSWVDRMLGGRGEVPDTDRLLTEVETALLEDALLEILREWCRAWADEVELNPEILGHETHPRFAQATAPETIMVAARYGVGEEGSKLGFEFGLPLMAVGPLFKKRRDRKNRNWNSRMSDDAGDWSPIYDQVAVPVTVEWQISQMTLGELASLKVDDTHELPAELLEKACIQISGIHKFTGTLGVEDGRVAVMINE